MDSCCVDDNHINGLDLEASVAWMSIKQASVVRKRVYSVQNTIKRRKAKRFNEGARGKDRSDTGLSQDSTNVSRLVELLI